MTDTIWIRSTIDPDTRKAACLLEWGPIQALLQPDTVLTTARNLMAAAAAAETDIAFLAWCRQTLKVDIHTAGHMLRDIRTARPAPTDAVLRIEALAGANTGLPLIHISRGSQKGELAPNDARQMAQHWTEAAAAAQIDVRLRHVLGDLGHLLTPGDVEEIFTKLQSLQQ